MRGDIISSYTVKKLICALTFTLKSNMVSNDCRVGRGSQTSPAFLTGEWRIWGSWGEELACLCCLSRATWTNSWPEVFNSKSHFWTTPDYGVGPCNHCKRLGFFLRVGRFCRWLLPCILYLHKIFPCKSGHFWPCHYILGIHLIWALVGPPMSWL